jgi:hypothetical protein
MKKKKGARFFLERRPRAATALVNEPMTEAELERVRMCVNRGRPFGEESWQRHTAARLGVEASPRSRGRPRKSEGRRKNRPEKNLNVPFSRPPWS